MLRIKKMYAVLATAGAMLTVPLGTASANTSGPPTAPNGANFNRQTTVCHHNSPPNGSVTVINKNRTNENGSGGDDSSCLV
jgi:hypothetical protein